MAAAAGISKGGVLYHFPSKQALLEGMLERVMADYSARADAHLHNQEGSTISAWISAEESRTNEERSMTLAILASAAEDPSLLAPARSLLKHTVDTVRREAEDPDLAVILLLATEGMRFLDILDLLPFSAAQRRRLQQRIRSLAETEA